MKDTYNAETADHFALTTLRCRRSLVQGKTFVVFEGRNAGQIGSYGRTGSYRVETHTFEGLSGLSELLREIAKKPRLAIIRGKPLFDLRSSNWEPKLLHDQPQFKRGEDGKPDKSQPIIDKETGEKVIIAATFEAVRRSWFMGDIDNLDRELWRGCDPVKDIERIVRRWRATLPVWLQKTAMLVQLSSSHGLALADETGAFKPAEPKFHAYMLSDRPLDAAEVDLVMKLIGADPAPARPVQHIYTADPTFVNEEGEVIDDPLACDRWFIIEGEPFASIPYCDDPVFADVRVSHGAGGGHRPPLGVVASDYYAGDVRSGWRGYLDVAGSADLANGHFRGGFMSAAASFFQKEGPDADLTEFWEQCEPLFERAAAQRGQGYADHARKSDYPDIVADIREKERQSRKGKLLEPAKMLPQLTTWAPELQYPLPPRKEARGGPGDPDWRAARRLDMRGVGAGKTEEALRGIIDMIRAIDIDDVGSGANLLAEPDAVVGDRVYILVQSIKLALELEARTLAMLDGETDIDVILWRGMEQPDPDAVPFLMCRRIGDMDAALTTGGSSQDVCGVKGKGMCSYNRFAPGKTCGFQQQKALTAQAKRKPAIVILAGAYFAAHVPPKDARAKISTEGEELQLVRGGTHEVKLPEALHVVLDEWRPGEVHVTLDRNSFCPIEDIKVVSCIIPGAEIADDWHKAVNVSALATYEALMEENPLSLDEMDALRRVGAALMAGRDGLADWDMLDAGRFQAELSGPPSFVKINGEKVEVLDFVLPIDTAQDALVAVRKLIIQPRDTARGGYAAETEELWEVSRDAALNRDTAGAADDLKPRDFVNLLAHNIRLMRMQVVLAALVQGLSDIYRNRRKDQQVLTVQAASKTFERMHISGYTTGMREDLAPWLRDVPITVLDATAEPEIVKQWLGDDIFEIKDDGIAPMPEHVRVRQIEDAQMGYNHLGLSGKDQHRRWVRRMRAYIYAAAIQHHGQSNGPYDVGVVMPLSLAMRIGELPPRVCAVTWGSESGVNVLETVARGIVISRKLPGSFDLKNRAAICFGYPVEDGGFIKIFPVRLVRKIGVIYWYKSKASEIMKHADERAEILRRQICDGSFNQGIGRFRAHRRMVETPLVLDVITNHPMATVPVDDLWFEADLRRETDCDELRRVSAGIAIIGSRGKNIIMALTSGRAGDAFTSCMEELRAQHFKNTGKKPGKLGKKLHAELTEKSQVHAINQATHQVKVALARKAKIKAGSDTMPIIKGSIIGIVSDPAFSDRFLPDFAVLSSMDARSAAPAKIVFAQGKRPIRVLVRLDGDDTENTRKLAENRLKQFFYFPLVSFEWEARASKDDQDPYFDVLG